MADILHSLQNKCVFKCVKHDFGLAAYMYGDVVLQGFEFIKPKIMLEQSEVLANKKKNTIQQQRKKVDSFF